MSDAKPAEGCSESKARATVLLTGMVFALGSCVAFDTLGPSATSSFFGFMGGALMFAAVKP